MFSTINLIEVIDINNTCYNFINIPNIKKSIDKSNNNISNKNNSIYKKDNTAIIKTIKTNDDPVICIIPMWIQSFTQKENCLNCMNCMKILLKQTNNLLTIPFKIRKDIHKHIRIYAKKQYGISKKSIVNIVTIKDNCYGIIVNSTCLQKQNLEIDWRSFFLSSTKQTNNFFKDILNTKYFYNTIFNHLYNTI